MMALIWFLVVWAVVMATIHYFRKDKDKNNKSRKTR